MKRNCIEFRRGERRVLDDVLARKVFAKQIYSFYM